MSIALCVDCSEKLAESFTPLPPHEENFELCRSKIAECITIIPEFHTWLPVKKKWFITMILQYYCLVKIPAQEDFVTKLLSVFPPPEEDVDEEFICPISYEIMSDPVRASDGKIYDRKNIEAHFNKYRGGDPTIYSPLIGTEISRTLAPLPELRERIENRDIEYTFVRVKENGRYDISKIWSGTKTERTPTYIDHENKIIFVAGKQYGTLELDCPFKPDLELLFWTSIPHLYSQLYDKSDGTISGQLVLYTDNCGQIFTCQIKSMYHYQPIGYDIIPFKPDIDVNLLTRFPIAEQFIEIFRENLLDEGIDVRLIAFSSDVREVDVLPTPNGKLRKLYDALDFARNSFHPERIIILTCGNDNGSLLKLEQLGRIGDVSIIKLDDFILTKGISQKTIDVKINEPKKLLYEHIYKYFKSSEAEFSPHKHTLDKPSTLRLMREFSECLDWNGVPTPRHRDGHVVFGVQLIENNLRKWSIVISGKTFYIDFHDGWPDRAPLVRVENFAHLNVEKNGRVCIPLKWTNAISAHAIISSIIQMLEKPDPSFAANIDMHPLQ